MGPHMGESSFAAAYVVHWFWAFVAVGGAFAFVFENEVLDVSGVDWGVSLNPLAEIRHALAGAILLLFIASDDPFAGTAILVAVGTIEVAIWPAALKLIPFFAHGEGPRRTYFRCVKLLLWSTVYCVPVFWLFARITAGVSLYFIGEPVLAMLGLLLLELWWLLALLRMGGTLRRPARGTPLDAAATAL